MTDVGIDHKIDGTGQLYGFSYHDGYLAGFSVGHDGMTFDLVSIAGERYRLHALQVYDFSVTDFWNGAIVSDILLHKLSQVPLSSQATDAGLGHLYSGRSRLDDIAAIVARQLQNNPDMILLQLDCSYGGTFSCLCAEVRVVKLCVDPSDPILADFSPDTAQKALLRGAAQGKEIL